MGRDQATDAHDAGDDEDRVAEGAHGDDQPDVVACEARAQHVRVLGADGDDERRHRQEAGEEGGHASDGTAVVGFSEAKDSSSSLAWLHAAAARRLHVTASAVSQLVKALEAEVGQVVVVRATPCRATSAGEALVRLARQQGLLESEALAGLAAGGDGRVDLPVAVNADSMSTWFGGVLTQVAAWQARQCTTRVVGSTGISRSITADLVR